MLPYLEIWILTCNLYQSSYDNLQLHVEKLRGRYFLILQVSGISNSLKHSVLFGKKSELALMYVKSRNLEISILQIQEDFKK